MALEPGIAPIQTIKQVSASIPMRSRLNHSGVRLVALFALVNGVSLLIPLIFILQAPSEVTDRLNGLFLPTIVPAALSLLASVGLYRGSAWGCTVLCLRSLLGMFWGGTTLLSMFERRLPFGAFNDLFLQISEFLILAWLTWEFWRARPETRATELGENPDKGGEQTAAQPSLANPIRPWGTVIAFVLTVVGFAVWLTEVRFFQFAPTRLAEIPLIGPSIADLNAEGPLLATGTTRSWGREGQWVISGEANESEIKRFANDHHWTTTTNSTSKAHAMARNWKLDPNQYPWRDQIDFTEVHVGRLAPPLRGVGILTWRANDRRFCLETHVLGQSRETSR